MVDIAIIGAGPYGLSIAAHLKGLGIEFRIFGSPMHTWLHQMPKGMFLKSEGFASTLYDPASSCTLGQYCQENRIPYADLARPVPMDVFSSYGLEFQRRMVPELENQQAVFMERSASGYRVGLANGEVASARRVVAAVGLTHFAYVPPVLRTLPAEVASHSSSRRTYDEFRGRKVVIVGAGASAADTAVTLMDAGAQVEIVARRNVFRFHDPLRLPRPLIDRIRYPMTGLGPGWRSLACVKMPLVFRHMPEDFRVKVVRKHLGPAAGWVVKERLVGHVPFHLGCQIQGADVRNGQVHLELAGQDGSRETLAADHVISATGYRVDLSRLAFLSPEILGGIRTLDKSPMLSSNFESSIPGLYFVGTASANTFGPLARFAYGAGFTSKRLSAHLARVASRSSVHREEPVAA